MYTCVRAIIQGRSDNARFTQIADAADAVLRSLLNENNQVFLILTHPAVTHELSLDLSLVTNKVYAVHPDLTVGDWLVSLGTQSLPTTNTLPEVTAGLVKYNDAFAAGYKLERVHPTAGKDSQFPPADYTDLLITKTDADYEKFYKHILVTINGLAHIADYSTAGIKVKGGGASVYKANRHNIGLMSFLDVGELSFYPIDASMVKPRFSDKLSNGLTLQVPGVDLSNKVVFLSLGGFLHFTGGYFSVIGDNTLILDWNKIPLAPRYFHSKPLIDLSGFEETLVRNESHGDALDLKQAASNESILAYLGLAQSFIVVLEADNFYVERHQLEKTGLPGRFYAYDRPEWPLQLENGTLPAYLAMPEQGMYSVCVEENLVPRYVSETVPASINYDNGAEITMYARYYSSGYLLEMGTELIKQSA